MQVSMVSGERCLSTCLERCHVVRPTDVPISVCTRCGVQVVCAAVIAAERSRSNAVDTADAHVRFHAQAHAHGRAHML